MDSETVTALGSGLAAFLATWAAFVRPLSKRVGANASGSEVAALDKRLAELAQQNQALEKKIDALEGAFKEWRRELRDRLDKLEDRQQRNVTDDEFATYTQATTTAINGLTEKVARAAGILEAKSWRQTQT